MRLDLFLRKTLLVQQRALAKELCDAGAVRVNARPAKPSQAVRTGDTIRLRLPERYLEVRVRGLPAGNVARRDVGEYVEVLQDARADRIERVFGGLDTDSSAGDAAGIDAEDDF